MATLLSEPPLTEKLRQLSSLLSSDDALALTATELAEAKRLLEAFPIEVAELRASPKQLALQRAFLNRADESGRPCDIFACLGGNRSGKTFACGWLCLAKYIRD